MFPAPHLTHKIKQHLPFPFLAIPEATSCFTIFPVKKCPLPSVYEGEAAEKEL